MGPSSNVPVIKKDIATAPGKISHLLCFYIMVNLKNRYIIIVCESFIKPYLLIMMFWRKTHWFYKSTSSITVTSLWMWWHLKSPASWWFAQSFVQAAIKEKIEALHHWPLWGEFTDDCWIPLTRGQYLGKCFHFMTSSCSYDELLYHPPSQNSWKNLFKWWMPVIWLHILCHEFYKSWFKILIN